MLNFARLFILNQIYLSIMALKYPLRWRKELITAKDPSVNDKYFQVLNFEDALQTGIARVLLHGPPNSPYQGYSFELQYNGWEIPYRPPTIVFLNIPWSPFVCPKTGRICADIFETQWSPASTFQKVLVSITSLLSQNRLPEKQPGLNLEAAAQMNLKYSQYFKHAKEQAQLRHYKKQLFYKDDQKYAPNYPPDLIKQDLEYMQKKDNFSNNPEIKQRHEKKLKEFFKN